MNVITIWKMALRNVWRNKRRTLITGASVMFAVFFASLMESVQQGAWDYMIHNIVGFHTGYLQVHSKGYWDEQTLNNVMEVSEVEDRMRDVEFDAFPRVENFALASFATKTKGVLVVGADPENEHRLTSLDQRVYEGDYLKDSLDILIASGLAEYLGLTIGDSIVLLSQGRHGANAAGIFHVSGLVKFGSPELNDQLCYISIDDAQALFNMYGLASSYVVDVENEEEMKMAKTAVTAAFSSEDFEVMNYEELLPDIMQAREFDDLSGRVIILVLYLLIGFGIFGTLLMMLRERQYEFGVLKAIGFKSPQLYSMVWFEIIIVAIGGVLAGILLSTPIIYYFSENPIRFTGDYAAVYEGFGMEPVLPFKLDLTIMLMQAFIVFTITTVMSIYAYFKISGLKSVKAMRG